MFEALLRGKLSRSQENMEDLLTSMVFGTLRRLDLGVVGALLRRAQDLEGSRPLADLPPLVQASWTDDDATATAFWPWLQADGCRGCEPDVLLRVQRKDGRWLLVLVEVKYRSGKSSFDDDERDESVALPANDQLAREWENVKALSGGDDACVLYVTPSIVMPEEDIHEAQRELREKRSAPGTFLWVSVREVVLALKESADPWARALETALARLGLLPFVPFGTPSPPPSPWRFAPWNWPEANLPAPWRFSR